MEIVDIIQNKRSKKREDQRKEKIFKQFNSKRSLIYKALLEDDNEEVPNNAKYQMVSEDLDVNSFQKQFEIEQLLLTEIGEIDSTTISSALNYLNKTIDSDQDYLFASKFSIFNIPVCENCIKEYSYGRVLGFLQNQGWRCYTPSCNKRKVSLYTSYKIFKQLKLALPILLKLFTQFLPNLEENQHFKQQFDISDDQIIKARSLWQGIVFKHFVQYYETLTLGEYSKVVEIDESKFKRKANKGRFLRRSSWLLGLTGRNSGFNRSKCINTSAYNLVIRVNKQRLSLYRFLEGQLWFNQLGYNHKMVNHSKNFVKPKPVQSQTSSESSTKIKEKQSTQKQTKQERNYELYNGHPIHTQSIECKWLHLKNKLRLLKGKRRSYLQDVYVCLFQLNYKENIEKMALQIMKEYISQESENTNENENSRRIQRKQSDL